MNDIPQWESLAHPLIRTLRIVTIGLIVSVIILAGVMGFVVRNSGPALQNPNQQGLSMLTIIAFVFAAVSLIQAVFLPGVVTKQKRRQIAAQPQLPDPAQQTQQLFATYRAIHIMRLAFLEGAALLAVVFYFLEGETYVLAVGAVMLMFMTIYFPNSLHLLRWVETQWVLIEDERRRLNLPAVRHEIQ